jgi:hypothetical protein
MTTALRQLAIGVLLGLATPGILDAQPSVDAGTPALARAGAIAARHDWRLARWNPSALYGAPRSFHATVETAAGALAGLVDGAILCVAPVDSTTSVGASLAGVSYGPYGHVEIAAAAARRLAGDWTAGAQLRFASLAVTDYGVAHALLVDAGVLGRLHPTIAVGVVARNITGSSLRGVPLPQQIALGIALPVADSIELGLDLLHDVGRDVTTAAGITIGVAEGLCVSVGAALPTIVASCGFAYDDGSICVEVACAWWESAGARLSAGVGRRW